MTPSSLSDAELIAWQELCAQATPGPWRFFGETCTYAVNGPQSTSFDPDSRVVQGDSEGHQFAGGITKFDDAKFIAASNPLAVSRLLAEVQAQRGKTCETCRFKGGSGADIDTHTCKWPWIRYLNDSEGIGHETIVPNKANGQPFGCSAHEAADAKEEK